MSANLWGTTQVNEADSNKTGKLNDADSAIIAGVSDVIPENFATDADHTPVPATVIAAMHINLTSSGALTATRNLILPKIRKRWVIKNGTTGGQTITVKGSTGTGVNVTNGSLGAVVFDGTNFIATL